MKNLLTRKLLFGVLMIFVLGLGVQEVVDAVEKPTDPGAALNPTTVYNVGGSPSDISVTLNLDKPGTTETVSISTGGGGIILTGDFYGLTSVSLREDGDQTDSDPNTDGNQPANGNMFTYSKDGRNLPLGIGAVTIPITFTTKGKKTVRISGRDYEGDDTGSWSYTYTYYVKGPGTDTTTVSLVGLSNGYKDGIFAGESNYILVHRGDTSHYDVDYTTIPSGGTFQIEQTDGSLGNDVTNATGQSSIFDVFLKMDQTRQVTAEVEDSDVTTVGTYIVGSPTLTVGYPNDPDGDGDTTDGTGFGSKSNPGAINSTISNAFIATVNDGSGTGTVPGVVVRFQVRGSGNAGGYLVFDSGNAGTLVESNNRERLGANGNPLEDDTAKTLYVRTLAAGIANVDFQLGTDGKQDVTVTAVGQSETVSAYAETFTSGNQLVDPSSTSREGKYDIRVTAEDSEGNKLTGTTVQFTTNDGTLDDPINNDLATRAAVDVSTDTRGIALVVFDPHDDSGTLKVTARLWDLGNDSTVGGSGDDADTIVAETVINVRGGGSITPITPRTTNPTITLTPSSISGDAGNTRLIRATAADQNRSPVSDVLVTFSLGTASSTSFSDATVRTDSFGRADATLTLPSSSDTVFARATVDGLRVVDSINVTVTSKAPEAVPEVPADTSGAPSRLMVFSGDDQIGDVNRRLDEDLTVRVLDSNGRGVESEVVRFRITDGRGRLSPASSRTDDDGFASTTFTPRSDGTIEVEAVSGNLSSVIFTITTGEPPDAIVLVSGNNQSGRPGAALANPFIVEVIDENDDTVSGVTVAFAVTAGGGTLSATSATTNASGRAQTTLTLGDTPGDNTVAARVTGLAGITFKATSGSQVLVDASQRAPMYWISRTNGKLHRLVDDEIENLAPNVTGVTSLAVDSANGLLYFGVKTGENRGAVRRSNLNGRSVQTLKTLTSVPTGIAIDSAGGTVYWTNSRGRIQSIPTEDSAKITNILQNLPNPMALVLSNGHLYWGEPLGRLRRVSLTDAQKIVQNIATGLGEPLSLSIAKGKIYWTERGVGGSGSLQRSNLDGTSIQELKTFASGVPIGLAVDSSDNKIYWTKGAGKIQRANLAGRFVKDIATGVMNPGDIALGTAAVAEPVVETVTRTPRANQTTPQADNTKYDVNGDGAVDNIDVTLVAVALGSSNAKYDVNGDGTVDANDLRAVIANADDAAAAPAIDVDFTTLNVDMIQEQIDILLASSDTSLAGQRTLAYLQQMLASARPDETVLLANYPNPFNPETWIPYHLATGTDVQVNIYNTQGTLVRMLTLGHQSAGYYTSRSRAAYWDGRNAFGERVASGIYFYQLQTDKISPMRKMVILK